MTRFPAKPRRVPIDVDEMVERVMRRFPKIMARLRESELAEDDGE